MKCAVLSCKSEAELVATFSDKEQYNLCKPCWDYLEQQEEVFDYDPTPQRYWRDGVRIRPLEPMEVTVP